jgi:PhzF family phenazine biosynthesis protein
MQKIKMYQVDAFTSELFRGNPAAVCVLDEWLEDDIMQKIGAENNLAETAFIVPEKGHYGIVWFTPEVEIDLCGHATLASAYVLFEEEGFQQPEITFRTRTRGDLKVKRKDKLLIMDFPAEPVVLVDRNKEVEKAIGIRPRSVFKGKSKFLAEMEHEDQVARLSPDANEVAKLDGGLIVTAPGKEVDFVSRFFVPQFGIDEDPVTGSAHTLLIPFWAQKLNKEKMVARQISSRGGVLYCRNNGPRVEIGGEARLYLKGEIFI